MSRINANARKAKHVTTEKLAELVAEKLAGLPEQEKAKLRRSLVNRATDGPPKYLTRSFPIIMEVN